MHFDCDLFSSPITSGFKVMKDYLKEREKDKTKKEGKNVLKRLLDFFFKNLFYMVWCLGKREREKERKKEAINVCFA